jgi:hypothetical protein
VPQIADARITALLDLPQAAASGHRMRALRGNSRHLKAAGSRFRSIQIRHVRLRIERGVLAQTLNEREKTKRAAALGQGELHSREPRDLSTRAHLDDPRQLSPTLGVSVAGGGDGPLIRVAVLDERAL